MHAASFVLSSSKDANLEAVDDDADGDAGFNGKIGCPPAEFTDNARDRATGGERVAEEVGLKLACLEGSKTAAVESQIVRREVHKKSVKIGITMDSGTCVDSLIVLFSWCALCK
jgi:hypothetical protein